MYSEHFEVPAFGGNNAILAPDNAGYYYHDYANTILSGPVMKESTGI